MNLQEFSKDVGDLTVTFVYYGWREIGYVMCVPDGGEWMAYAYREAGQYTKPVPATFHATKGGAVKQIVDGYALRLIGEQAGEENDQ